MASTSKCSGCGEQVASGAKFCRHCGAALDATEIVGSAPPAGAEGAEPKPGICPACSAPVPPDASFCRSCGERQPGAVKEDAATAQPSPPPPNAYPSPPAPSNVPPPPPPLAGPRQTPAPPPSSGSRGPLLALAAIGACLALGGLVFGGVYLLTGDDPGAAESIPSVEEAPDDWLEEEETQESESPESLGGGQFPTERGFPTDSKPAMRTEAEELLREFHVALVERDFRYAWSLLTARKRRKETQEKGYSGWKQAQATLTPYLIPGGIDVQIDDLEDEGVARVLVTGMGWAQPGSPCSEWSGLTWVRYEGGAWRYDPGYSTTAERRRRWQGRSGELLGVGC